MPKGNLSVMRVSDNVVIATGVVSAKAALAVMQNDVQERKKDDSYLVLTVYKGLNNGEPNPIGYNESEEDNNGPETFD